MKINKYVLPGLVLLLFLGTVLVAQATGNWSTSAQKTGPVTLASSAEIKGWMTLQQVADGFGLEQAELYELLELPADVPPGTPLKELGTILPGFEVSLAREAIGRYLGETPAAP